MAPVSITIPRVARPAEDEVYAELRPLAEAVARTGCRVDAVVQFRLADPEAVITVDLRLDTGPRVVCGPCDLRPDLVLGMPARTAALFLGGKVNLAVALARRQITASGQRGKLLRLLPAARRELAGA